jgi:Ca2+-binding RTX toxin-like protein
MRLSNAFAAAIALSIATAAPATAAEVSLVSDALTYDGFDSEANAVVVERPATNTVTVTDAPGVMISPGAGCTNPEADNTVTCTGFVIGITVHTRGGDDLIDLSSSSLGAIQSTINGGAGNDVLRGSGRRDDLLGEGGNDLLEGGPDTDRIFGGAGRDIASYESETDPVTVDLAENTANDGPAGDTDDVNKDGQVEGVIGGSAGDTILGTGEADQIDGAGGPDVIDGGAGADSLSGGGGMDGIDGGPDSDRISGDGGSGAGNPAADSLLGGTEDDAVVYDERSLPVVVDLEDPGVDGSAGEGDDLAEFEGVVGGEGDDVLVGDAGANTLAGNVGDDVIDGGPELDQLLGGNGSDTVSYARRTNAVSVLVGPHGGGGEPNEGDHIEGMENARGGDGADNLRGDDSPNALDGGPGEDTLSGAGDRDLLQGGDGADALNGEDGDDTISGDAGPDTADGGPGGDALRMRDGEADSVSCGTEFDSAIVDPIDTLDGCDSADTGVPPEPVEKIIEVQTQVPVPVPGAAAPASAGPPAATDDKRPTITLGRLPSTMKLRSFVKGVKVSAGCDEPCSLDVELRGSARTVRIARSYDLTLGTRSLPRAAGTRSLTLKPARRLVGRARRLTAQLRVTAIDAAGNRSTKTKTIKVR